MKIENLGHDPAHRLIFCTVNLAWSNLGVFPVHSVLIVYPSGHDVFVLFPGETSCWWTSVKRLTTRVICKQNNLGCFGNQTFSFLRSFWPKRGRSARMAKAMTPWGEEVDVAGPNAGRFAELRAQMPIGARLWRRLTKWIKSPPNFERLVLGCIEADVCQ